MKKKIRDLTVEDLVTRHIEIPNDECCGIQDALIGQSEYGIPFEESYNLDDEVEVTDIED